MWIYRRLTLELHAYRSYDIKSLLLSWCVAVVNECESSPCVNGVCQDLVNHYYCQCITGWTGRNCDQSGLFKAFHGVALRFSSLIALMLLT